MILRRSRFGRFSGDLLVKFAWVILAVSFVQARPSESTAEPPASTKPARTLALFDGKSLDGWRIVKMNDFERHGKVAVREGQIILDAGRPATGISYQGKFPHDNYEVSLEARRIDGSDFFCGMTFPVGQQYCTLIVGGWGGGITGLSNVDGDSAVENETTDFLDVEPNRFYRIRLRVSRQAIEAWIDDDQIVNVERKGRRFSIWWEQEPVRPFGIATWYTKAGLRNIQLTRLEPADRQPNAPR